MEKRKLILCRGIQASGKSTWAKAWAKEDPEHRVRFNNDDIRNMLGEYWATFTKGNLTYSVDGSHYYGNCKVEKVYDN